MSPHPFPLSQSCPGFSPGSKRYSIQPQCACLRLSPDASFQKDDSTKAIKELKDGDTGLPFNMEYSALAALLDALKDPNAIDDRKMLVSVPPYLGTVARTLTSHVVHSWSRF